MAGLKDGFPTVMIVPRGYGVNRVVIMIGNELISPFHVYILEGLKLSFDTSCVFLKNSLDNLLLVRLKKIIFMHDNAPSHAAKTTTQFLTLLGFVKNLGFLKCN